MEEDPFARFRELLNSNHQFPGVYTHKFIGKNTPEFVSGVEEFEKKFIGLKRVGEKRSTTDKHLSLTYEYHAAHADDVIDLAKKTYEIPHLIYIL